MPSVFSQPADPAAEAPARTTTQDHEDRRSHPPTIDAAGADAGAVLDGRYRLGELIGQGGMATVHAAHDLLLNREVAVKVFRARATRRSDMRAQEAEARVIASLNHYALTTLLDAGIEGAGSDSPQIYLVMERVATDLRARLRQGPLSVVEACWLGFDLSEALDYVHQAGFLHRDIKPANVLLSSLQSAKPIVGKLADFGIATLIGQPDDSEFTTGTAAYLSPEQAEGHDAGAASDVYALGLVLLECITGRVEYPGGIEESAFARLDRSPVVPGDLPELVQRILRGMTARRPEDRLPLGEAALQFQQHLVDVLVEMRGPLPPAAAPDDEALRVAVLRSYNILDTGPDETFNTITRVASTILDTPIALVTLVDKDRVWFKSHLGWDQQEVDRDVAFCTTTNPGTAGPWTIPDALADARTAHNPLVTAGPLVRSYAGAPLITRDGHDLGALCVFDHQARAFTPRQLSALADLAGLVMHEIEMRDATRRALFKGD